MRPLVWWMLIGANVLTFLVYGWDKMSARNGWRRVPEARLLWLAFLGGVVGAWAAVSTFRHKTVKTSFRWRLWLVSVLNPLWAGLYWLYFA